MSSIIPLLQSGIFMIMIIMCGLIIAYCYIIASKPKKRN